MPIVRFSQEPESISLQQIAELLDMLGDEIKRRSKRQADRKTSVLNDQGVRLRDAAARLDEAIQLLDEIEQVEAARLMELTRKGYAMLRDAGGAA